jgi:hypothetical protein
MASKCKLGLALVLLLCTSLYAGQVIDRIVVKVNGHVILQSDWDDAVHCEAIINGRPVSEFKPLERKQVLDRLIDQELLREQISREENPSVSETDVLRRLAEIRKFYSGQSAVENGQAWGKMLSEYQVTEQQIKARIALQFQLMQLVNVHLRPQVQIDQSNVEAYYNQDFLPRLRKEGTSVPLAKAAPQIREILIQQKMNQLLVAWLQDLRAASKIVTVPADAGAGAQ